MIPKSCRSAEWDKRSEALNETIEMKTPLKSGWWELLTTLTFPFWLASLPPSSRFRQTSLPEQPFSVRVNGDTAPVTTPPKVTWPTSLWLIFVTLVSEVAAAGLGAGIGSGFASELQQPWQPLRNPGYKTNREKLTSILVLFPQAPCLVPQ